MKMKRVLSTILLCTLTLIFIGCDGNYKKIKVNGLVSDQATGYPIHNAIVTVTCWAYDTRIWESKSLERSTTTDENGRFSIDFEKGEALDFVVKSENYNEYRESITLKKSINTFDIKLIKID